MEYVVGGTEQFQFASRRWKKSTGRAGHPVILHLHDRAANRATRVAGYTGHARRRDCSRPSNGNRPVCWSRGRGCDDSLSTLAQRAQLPLVSGQLDRQFMRELNRLDLTSAIDAGGGFQNYPDVIK